MAKSQRWKRLMDRTEAQRAASRAVSQAHQVQVLRRVQERQSKLRRGRTVRLQVREGLTAIVKENKS